MKTKKHTIKTLTSVCSILVFTGSLLFFAEDAQARRRHNRAAPNPSPAFQSEATSKTDVGGRQEGSASAPSGTAVSLPTSLSGMAVVPGNREASASTPSSASVSRPSTLTGINVSFKLDPGHTKGLFMGESWVSPPISIHAGAQKGTTTTVEARADVLDAKGSPMDISPEWIPADSEMVAVSPDQGNDVMITVRHAGQSSLQVISQKVSKKLSIMAWYQDDALQVEISEKP